MRALRALAGIVYDFVVGDRWQLSLAIALILAAAIACLRLGWLPEAAILPVLAVAVLLLAPALVVVEARGAGRG